MRSHCQIPLALSFAQNPIRPEEPAKRASRRTAFGGLASSNAVHGSASPPSTELRTGFDAPASRVAQGERLSSVVRAAETQFPAPARPSLRGLRTNGWSASLAVVVAALATACAEKRPPDPVDPGPPTRAIESLDGLPGEPCGTDPLRVIIRMPQPTDDFCIDRFEAGVDGQNLGNTHQAGGDDTNDSLDGSTLAVATLDLGVQPVTNVTWYQAKAACENAGKRLCTLTEWERACRGSVQFEFIYPYGDVHDETACNGFFNFNEVNPASTGSLQSCGSSFGVYDLSGNLEEWVDERAEGIPGSNVFDHRFLRGGSFRGNENALRCIGTEFHDTPGTAQDDRGFRCCSALPP